MITDEDIDRVSKAFQTIQTEYVNPELASLEDESLLKSQADHYANPVYKQILNDREIVMDLRDIFANDTEVLDAQDTLGRISA